MLAYICSPGVAVRGQALPRLHAAAGHSEGAQAAPIQPGQQIFGGVLCCPPAVMSPFQNLGDALLAGWVYWEVGSGTER